MLRLPQQGYTLFTREVLVWRPAGTDRTFFVPLAAQCGCWLLWQVALSNAARGSLMLPARMGFLSLLITASILWMGCDASDVSDSPGPLLQPVSASDNDPLPIALTFSGASIDKAVKDSIEMTAPRPTDEEIGLACQALHRTGWDYMSMGMRTSGRSMSIAAAITMYASGEQLVNYCKSKIGTDSTGQMLPCADVQNQFTRRVVSLYQETGQYPGRIQSMSAVPESFHMEQYAEYFLPTAGGYTTHHVEHRVEMDFIMEHQDGEEKTVTMGGSMDVNDCSWNGVGLKPKIRPTSPPAATTSPTSAPTRTPGPRATWPPTAIPLSILFPTGNTYESCEDAEVANKERIKGKWGPGWGFPAAMVPSELDTDGDGVICEQ